MLSTCQAVQNMKMIQVRNVPDDLHRALKERAAREGTTMSDLILAELVRLERRPAPEGAAREGPTMWALTLAELVRLERRPSPEELLARLASRAPVRGPAAADLV